MYGRRVHNMGTGWRDRSCPQKQAGRDPALTPSRIEPFQHRVGTSMKSIHRILLVALASLSFWTRGAESKICGSGEDMPEGSKVRIGVMHRPEECIRRSSDGDTLTMHYEGLLYKDCKEFDSSRLGAPFSFKLGRGEVIKGWDSGLFGMCEGEKRRLTIPSEFGYGSDGAGSDIPPDATLVFDVELLGIK